MTSVADVIAVRNTRTESNIGKRNGRFASWFVSPPETADKVVLVSWAIGGKTSSSTGLLFVGCHCVLP